MVTKAIPDSPDALLEVLSNPETAAVLMKDPGAWADYMRQYALKTMERDPEIQAQLKEVRDKGLKEYLEAHGYEPMVKRVPLAESSERGLYGWEPEYRKQLLRRANASSEWPSFGAFLTAIAPQVLKQGGWDTRLKANNENDPSAGGFTVPDVFVARLLMLELETAVVRPRAFILPMTSPTMRIPAIQDTSHATTVFGGVQAYWTSESGAVTESNPAFRQIALTARKLTGYTTTSNELLRDSALALETLLIMLFGRALGYFEDEAFMNGTGAGQPLGILNAGALISVAKETGQLANTIVVENIDKMASRMLPQSFARAVWVAHPNTMPQIVALSRNVGTGGSAVMMANVAGSPPVSIYGRPLIFTEKCQTLGTAGDIYFIDFDYYIIGDRQGMEMAASEHVRFTNDETVHKFVSRLDGQPWVNSAITPRYGTTTLSPFVALATRA